ncbi:hypothetical protein J5N58_21455 [Rhizobium cremeum]|uniref:hypothetical protein n=1 Tax=Rhizobium cremeum TaxID=2813827 RepID=UPI001FD4CE5E|nr:hypothetical protein [Rhizobium cremeum]MCJ7997036.1 hypothetical protein [Rhizobium cremeum]MCJ8002254.1 hypothetical protein [Rhizobium cremeum]
MSADIIPETSSSSTSARLKRGSSEAPETSQPPVAPRPQDDPALIIGLTLAFARQRQRDRRTIPSVLLDRLRHLARSGEPACRLVLDCLNRRAGANHRTAARQGVPPEIVSVLPAMKEDR